MYSNVSQIESVKALPEVVQTALRRVGYSKPDVIVYVSEKARRCDSGSEGRKGFCVIGNLATLEIGPTEEGSWGGANIFSRGNAVDLDTASYPMPPDAFVINGSRGYGPTYASVTIGPANAARLLTSGTANVTDREALILGLCGYVGGYKKEALAREGVTPAEIDALVARGFLTRNKIGATSRTTAGKNAAGKVY